MGSIYNNISTRSTDQAEKADERQVQNNAGGYSFEIPLASRVKRFLILGSEGGSYYQNAQKLTQENATAVVEMAKADGRALVDLILDVSLEGKAPKQNPALFALAIAASFGTIESKGYALSKLSDVARTGTHLFLFAGYVQQFRGWGPALAKAVARWYTDKPVDNLAYQAVKYRQREGWSHADLLRLSHPKTSEPARRGLFDWISGREAEGLPSIIEGFQQAQLGGDAAQLIADYGLSWEMIPDAVLNEASAWNAILDSGIGQTALIRQLPRLTKLGIIAPLGGRTREIADLIMNPERLRKARVHPISALVAQKAYAKGGEGWSPNPDIVDALDRAFYAAFGAVETSGKRTLIALDVSGSMSWETNQLGLTAMEVGAAMALVTKATEPDSAIVGFSHELVSLDISPKQRLTDVLNYVTRVPMGRTDCALPMVTALEKGWPVDTFVVITDNETYAGRPHPHQALQAYRERTGINAKLVVLAVTPTPFSIADPSDPGMLDIAGFGTDVPQLITEFSKGF